MAVALCKEGYIIEEMEKLRSELNKAIKNNEESSHVLYLSQKLDELIHLYYRSKIY